VSTACPEADGYRPGTSGIGVPGPLLYSCYPRLGCRRLTVTVDTSLFGRI